MTNLDNALAKSLLLVGDVIDVVRQPLVYLNITNSVVPAVFVLEDLTNV